MNIKHQFLSNLLNSSSLDFFDRFEDKERINDPLNGEKA